MFQKEVVVKNKTGLHARPAKDFVKVANQYGSSIYVDFKDKKLNAKSILNILGAGISSGSSIVISAVGEDEVDAVNSLVDFVENHVDE